MLDEITVCVVAARDGRAADAAVVAARVTVAVPAARRADVAVRAVVVDAAARDVVFVRVAVRADVAPRLVVVAAGANAAARVAVALGRDWDVDVVVARAATVPVRGVAAPVAVAVFWVVVVRPVVGVAARAMVLPSRTAACAPPMAIMPPKRNSEIFFIFLIC